nr:disease resistance response protein [Tanacetum cinerariifolium]
GPERNSTRVGRAQGMYASADFKEFSFMMVQNYVFDDERFNGSSLSILGRNPILSAVREFPVVGGSGVFRFASGYAEARTYFFNVTSGDAIVEYDVYVLHY